MIVYAVLLKRSAEKELDRLPGDVHARIEVFSIAHRREVYR
mgnify:CR=1 FL=1